MHRGLVLLTMIALAQPTWGEDGYSPDAVWSSWPESRFVEMAAPCLRHGDLQEELTRLVDLHGDLLTLETVGRSVENRSISLLRLGTGARRVLLWSQMHGDEPSATPALLDIAHLLASNRDEEPARSILTELTLLMVPMLNPDGAERYSRRNALGIDLNRDALHLETPEALLLKQLRDEHEPVMGFNLHDQSRRIMAGDTGKLATISLLSVAGDPDQTVTPGRRRTMRAGSAVVEALRAVSNIGADIGIGRYDEDWNPRAFGDNVTRWGTPVLLIESGGLPPGGDLRDLTRLNVVGILHALAGLARNDLGGYDISAYRELPRNARGAWADVVFRDATLVRLAGANDAGVATPVTYRADLAFDVMRSDIDLAECRAKIAASGGRSGIVDLGDASNRTAGQLIEADDKTLLPLLRIGLRGWRQRRHLDAQSLRRLALVGVSEIAWEPGNSKLADALDWIETQTRGQSALPAVRVVRSIPTGFWSSQSLALGAALDTGVSPKLGDRMAALGVSSIHDWLASAPSLRTGGRASFAVLAGEPTPDSRVLGVWLDGRELSSATK